MGGDRLTRRVFLTRSAAAGAALAVPGASRALAAPGASRALARPGASRALAAPGVAVEAAHCSARRFRTSLSVSPFTEGVLHSLGFASGHGVAHSVTGVQRLFVKHGSTEVYARIATRRHALASGAEMGFARGLDRARLARELGLPFNPELGLWAVYGDAEGQPAPDFSDYPSIRLPGPWHTLTLHEMTKALRHYGELVARQILRTGVRVDYWDIGNEIEFGIAGVATRPLNGERYQAPNRVDPAIGQMSTATLIGMSEPDRIAWLRAHLWPYVGKLLAATAEGIRSVHPSGRFSSHISGIFENDAAVALAFWESVHRAGYRPAQLGTSYYPTAGAIGGTGNRFEWIKTTAAALSRRFHKQLFIAEMGYPSGTMLPPYPYNTPLPGYPLSEHGQRRFIHDLVTWGARSGHLAGVRPWAPDLCTASSHWQPMSFFTAHGRRAHAKPVLGAIEAALRACD